MVALQHMNYHIFGIFCNSYGYIIEFIRDIKGSCKPAPARHCKSWIRGQFDQSE